MTPTTEAFLIAIASFAGTALAGWLLDRWLDLRGRLKRWRSRRQRAKHDRAALPGKIQQVLERTEKFAVEKTAAQAELNEHKARTTQQLATIGQQLETLPVLETAMKGVQQSMNLLHLRVGARADHSKLAECDFAPDFQMVGVNATLARRLGVGKPELLRFGYMGFIHPDDVGPFRAEWTLCAREHRPFQRNLRWRRPSDGLILRMHWTMQPLPEPPATPIQQWLGIGAYELDEEEEEE